MVRFLKNVYHRLTAMAACLYYGFPARHMTVIGVTGTDGKTTTTSLIYHLLKTAGYRVAGITTVGAYIGGRTVDTGFHVTSPQPWLLQKLIRRIRREGYTHLVLEVTSHGLDQSRVYGANIRYAVVTNVTHEHLDYHRTYDRYLAAKAGIFKTATVAVINADDASYDSLKTYLHPRTRLLAYSLKRGGEWAALAGRRFPETYNRENALAAITVCHALKVRKSVLKTGLETFPGVLGRMQTIPNRRGLRIVVDFAHTPNGLESALKALKATAKGKVIAVYGAAGERDASKRPVMGKIGAELADEVVLTAEDPRAEDPRLIIRDMKSGVSTNHGHVHAVVDRQEAIAFALRLAKKG